MNSAKQKDVISILVDDLGALKSEYEGYTRWDFQVGGNACVLIEPGTPAPRQRWVWKAEFFRAFPAFDLAMLARGWWTAFMSVGNTFGCPDAMDRFDTFYDVMTRSCGFHPRPVLEGLSRGGLYVYNWAVRDPSRVGLLFADNPVCDFKSWPGGKGSGPGSAADWQELLAAYHFASEAEALAWQGNPVDHLQALLAAGVPIAHVYGDADEVVPWEENSGVVAGKAAALGHPIYQVVKSGCKHHPHGPADPEAFADWVLAHVRP